MPDTVSSAGRLLNRANAAFRDERYADAEKLYRRYLAQPDALWHRERADAMLCLAGCRYASGSLTDAERWLLRACAEMPDRPAPWDCLAAFYSETDRPEPAAGCAARAKAALP